jgi:hypothetical protein
LFRVRGIRDHCPVFESTVPPVPFRFSSLYGSREYDLRCIGFRVEPQKLKPKVSGLGLGARSKAYAGLGFRV